MSKKRDYDKEIKDNFGRNYAYDFDIDVIHKFMMKSFESFFVEGSCLELGCYKGDFTKRLLEKFEKVTCIEASSDAVKEAYSKVGERVHIINSRFEEVELEQKFDNIILTHVLEHIDNPVNLLKKVNDDWLSEKGKLFLVCPNANAPSRQIAVQMGLVPYNSAVTEAERLHGHNITYTFDTLEKDAREAGLEIKYRNGIFFKALSNFQWDELLKTDIISPEYLEGCYELGQKYPDLCSSIFLLCQKK
ncbi:methyltransferase type 12 [Clostridium sulfidigenes]|uniref:Methyltransferase type 12 n=1 Tax=Clostridium sulfidigenes TaxID=318464 RepID=A0A084JIM5_9CLOT|nr:class I SAM-dependent methyltransferase [Clostridium sulfidigenes]KEZ88809.1 methyltransferase type 12 [Clostridium sulfidigenes]